MLQLRAKILYNKRVKDNYWHLVLRAPRITRESHPGQFLNVRINDAYEPLLRRPFSIQRVKGANIEILYEVVGEGTAMLSQKKAGEYLDIIGPLGNGFDYQASISHKDLPILVAGGMGVAPLMFLAEKLVKSKVPACPAGRKSQKSKVVLLIGAKTKSQILCEKEFKDLGCKVKVSTDDGSKGFKGTVTALLRYTLSTLNSQLSTIYACGPRPMLEEMSQISKKHKIPAQVALEEHMACGIGACLGCTVNTKDGFKRACKEGPVFNADEIV